MDTTRRTFLKSTAAAAGSLAFGLPAIQARNANEKINFAVVCRLDSAVEINYFRNGGILHTVLRKLLAESKSPAHAPAHA